MTFITIAFYLFNALYLLSLLLCPDYTTQQFVNNIFVAIVFSAWGCMAYRLYEKEKKKNEEKDECRDLPEDSARVERKTDN